MATKPFLNPVRERRHNIYPNRLAKSHARDTVDVHPWPVRYRGGTGWGKTVLLRIIVKMLYDEKKISQEAFEAVNFDPGMQVEDVVGRWRPHPLADECEACSKCEHGLKRMAAGVTVVWEHGPLTRAIVNGLPFLGEEWSRLNPESKSRVMGVTDETNRYWSVPELGQTLPVGQGFQFLTSENPHGQGYATRKEDPAIASRFAFTLDVDEPLAEEDRVIEDIFGGDMDATGRVMNFVIDSRRKAETRINTRDLVIFAKLIGRGIPPLKALTNSLLPKYELGRDILTTLGTAHFGEA